MALSLISDLLACPVCRDRMDLVDRVLRCRQGHAFDVARQGYVSLTGGSTRHPGDSATMVQARERVQQSGVFSGTARAIGHMLPDNVATMVDVGGGTGYYAAAALDEHVGCRAVVSDSSKAALKRAARIHQRAGAVGCDVVSGLPLRNGVVDAIIGAFAPRNVAEFARILRPGGVAIIVTPKPEHLCEIGPTMKMLHVDPAKTARLDEQMLGVFERGDRTQVVERMLVTRDLAGDLTQMGPAGFHATPTQITKRTANLAPVVATTFAANVTTYVRA